MTEQPLEIRVVLEAERYLVIDKPSGLLSVPGKGPENQVCVASLVRERFPQATGPVTIHRLDMDTSGLIVVALDPDTQREISGQFERREVEKSYTALVNGVVPFEKGAINVPIRPDFENRPMQIVDYEFGRPAITAWQVLAYETDRTRVQLVPHTGRTHQLRVHCAFDGPGGFGGDQPGHAHPILGDVLYGDSNSAPRLMLHATLLVFSDPSTGQRIQVQSVPPF